MDRLGEQLVESLCHLIERRRPGWFVSYQDVSPDLVLLSIHGPAGRPLTSAPLPISLGRLASDIPRAASAVIRVAEARARSPGDGRARPPRRRT